MKLEASRNIMKTKLSIQFLSNLVSASDRRISKTFILLTLSYTELIHSILKSVRRWIRTQIMNKESLSLIWSEFISMINFLGKSKVSYEACKRRIKPSCQMISILILRNWSIPAQLHFPRFSLSLKSSKIWKIKYFDTKIGFEFSSFDFWKLFCMLEPITKKKFQSML